MPRDTQRLSPTYDQLVNRTRALYAASHMFRGTKLDLTKEVGRTSVFTLSNTEHGMSLNYVLNGASQLFTVSVYSNGSILGKITPAQDTGGTSLTYMKSPNSAYLDFDLTKSGSLGSLTLKVINPEFDYNPKEQFSLLLSSISAISRESLAQQRDKLRQALSLPAGAIRDGLSRQFRQQRQKFRGGVFGLGGVLQATPSLHFGMEHLLSVDQIQASFKRHLVSTYLASKAFANYRVMALFQSTGKAGLSVEKTLDDAVTLYSDFFVDVRRLKRTAASFFNSTTGVVGISILGYSASTKVSASTDGTVDAVSDITLADGASLNLSTQITAGGSQIGVGFTIVS